MGNFVDYTSRTSFVTTDNYDNRFFGKPEPKEQDGIGYDNVFFTDKTGKSDRAFATQLRELDQRYTIWKAETEKDMWSRL